MKTGLQKNYALKAAFLLLLAVFAPSPGRAVTSERRWWLSRERMSDYEVAKSYADATRIACLTAASSDSAVQLATFNASSSLCTHFRCRLGLSHCRKCRNLNKGTEQVWTFSTDCWATVQHRVSGSVDFYRNWTQYQSEFGEGPDGNYWIGLNVLHSLTSFTPRKVRFLMTPWNGPVGWAEYSSASVGPAGYKYPLSVSGFSASPGIGDCFSNGHGQKFSTMDDDNDNLDENNCAAFFRGAWWFTSCHCTNPNGVYKDSSIAINGSYAQGIIWNLNYGYSYSLMEFEMLML